MVKACGFVLVVTVAPEAMTNAGNQRHSSSDSPRSALLHSSDLARGPPPGLGAPLRMSLRAFQILLPVATPEALRDALERALRRQKATAGPRRLVAVLADGWAMIDEEGRSGVDGGLARLLSELCGVALAIELDGGALSLRLRKFTQGEPVEGPWDAALKAAPFVDVEAVGWRALRDLGVPPSLRLCGPGSVGLADAALAAEGLVETGGFAALVVEVSAAGTTWSDARALPPERREGQDPPVVPDLWVKSATGEECALEVRALPALPVAREAAEALAAVEEAQARRLAGHLAAEVEGDRLPRLSFTYSEGRAALLLPLLQAARAGRPLLARLTEADRATVLSHAGFTSACRVALAAALPEARITRAHALRLELQPAPASGWTLRAPLPEAYARYLELPGEPADPAAPIVEAVRALLAATPAPLEDLPADALLSGLLPALALANDDAARASAVLAGPLRSALLFDDGRRIAAVTDEALARHGLTFEAALLRAVANVDALTLGEPAGLSYFDLDQGRVVIFDFSDPAGAGRVLSAHARGLLNDLLGEPCLCVVPTRDALLACSMLEEDAISWLQAEGQRRAAEGPHSLAPDLLVVTREAVSAYGPESELAAALAGAESR